jgi:hypothetical protein
MKLLPGNTFGSVAALKEQTGTVKEQRKGREKTDSENTRPKIEGPGSREFKGLSRFHRTVLYIL